MAYTIERLQQVRELFLHSNQAVDIGSGNDRKYSLRRRSTHTTAILSTWIDNDDDDTYEPKSHSRAKRKRPCTDLTTNRSPKRNRSDRFIVTMALASDTGKAFLASLPIHQDESSDQGDDIWKAAEEMMGALGPVEAAPPPDIKDPNAQACAMCMTVNLECVLTTDPYAYPCRFCAEHGISCELQVQPQWKRACENCKAARQPCSYEIQDTAHELPCKACRKSNEHCVAGPARNRPVPPAVSMSEAGSSTKTMPALKNKESSDGEVQRAATRTIRTALAHPVNFSYVPSEDGTNPCHWCDHFAFGLVGLGTRTVEVLDPGDGRLIEVGGGHVAEGQEPSRMCVTCALERIHVVQCPGHRIVPLKGYDPERFDFDAAYATLLGDGHRGPMKRSSNPWCSLCIAPAFFGCAAIQRVNVFREPVDAKSPEAKGCGLLLCEKCAMLLRVSRDVSWVVRRNETEMERGGETESRADVEYLLGGNVLYRAYLA